MRNFLSVLIVFSSFLNLFSQQNNILKTGLFADSAVTKLADGFAFTEGPAADEYGNVYFTDQPNNKILIWTTENKLKEFTNNSFRANGLYFDKIGNLIACTDLDNTLSSYNMKGERTIIFDNLDGKKVNAPNDIWLDENDGIYFTDPYYQRDWWERQKSELDGQYVYYVSPDRKSVTKVADDFVRPNGIIGSAKDKILYVADIEGNKTYRYKILENGILSPRELFCNEGSDGMTIDKDGNVYLTNDAVSIYNKEGKLVCKLPIPELPANVCFGGKDNNILFITARTSLYSIKMNLNGL